jgi:hypothetical protein
LAALLTALADESVTSGQPLAVSFSDTGYTFWERNLNETALNSSKRWRDRPGDELFARRQLQGEIHIVEVRIRQRPLSLSAKEVERIAFSPSGLHSPFSVLLALGDLRVNVASDAIGNLRVEDDEGAD